MASSDTSPVLTTLTQAYRIGVFVAPVPVCLLVAALRIQDAGRVRL